MTSCYSKWVPGCTLWAQRFTFLSDLHGKFAFHRVNRRKKSFNISMWKTKSTKKKLNSEQRLSLKKKKYHNNIQH